MRRRSSRHVWFSAAMASALAVTGCAGYDDIGNGRQARNGGDSGGIAGQSAAGAAIGTGADRQHEGIGTFMGRNGSQWIQLETPGGPMTFRLADGLEGIAGELKRNDRIAFTFTEHPIEGDVSGTLRVLVELAPTEPDADGPGVVQPTAAGRGGVTVHGLPTTKTFRLDGDGSTQGREAVLVEGEGFALYVFEPFLFNRTDSRLSLKIDPDYCADIVKLPSGYRTDDLRKEGEAWLRSLGAVEEVVGSRINGSLRGVSLFLTSTDDGVTQQYFVKEAEGAAYVFKVNVPHRGRAEAFLPLAYASLDSIVGIAR